MDTADNLRVNVNPSLFAPSLRDATDIGPLYREAVTNGFPVITTDHAFIHEGIAYTLSGTATVSGSWSLSFTTPATGYIHFKPAGISAAGGPVVVTLLEGPTFTGGSDATPRNRNRVISSPDSSTVACKTGVTPSGGTVINTLFIPGATSGSQKVGASTEAAEELVLDQATVYVLTLTETATGDVVCGYDLFWYEEEGA
jgi:hypothetical protein